jgi:hypothetical protein
MRERQLPGCIINRTIGFYLIMSFGPTQSPDRLLSLMKASVWAFCINWYKLEMNENYNKDGQKN